MRRRIAFFTILMSHCCMAFFANAQIFQFAKSFGSTGQDKGVKVATDSGGNIYLTGEFQGTVDFDPGVGVFTISAVGVTDIFVVKLNPSGDFIWAKSWGSAAYNSHVYAIFVDALSNVYTAGEFQGTCDFDPNPTTYNLFSTGTSSFTSKLNANGDFIWAKAVGTGFITKGRSLTVDMNGNVYTAGEFFGFGDFDPDTSSAFNLSSGGGIDAFILKLNTNGEFVWAKQFEGVNVFADEIKIGPANNVYLTGNFGGATDFDPGPSTYNLTPSGSNDGFFSILDSVGNFIWAGKFGGSGNDACKDFIIGPGGEIYITGVFSSTVDMDPGTGISNFTSNGSGDIFIIKLSGLGSFEWAITAGGTSNDQSNSIDWIGNYLVVAGYFASTIDIDPSAVVQTLASNGGVDIFTSIWDTSGSLQWATGLGGLGNEVVSNIHTADNGNVFMTGLFQQSVDFDPPNNIILNSNGGDDSFLFGSAFPNYFCTASTSSITTDACDSLVSPSGNYTFFTSGLYTDTISNVYGCDSIISINLTIYQSPSVTLNAVSSACIYDGAINLIGSPVGGTYSGPGVSGSSFDPATAGAGVHAITYEYTDGNGCTGNAIQNITVNAAPVVSLNPFSNVCNILPSFTLTGGSPAGGTYSGNGVSGNSFDPATAGVGTHVISYSYTDINGCSASSSQNISVDSCSCLPPNKPSTLSGAQRICYTTPEVFSIAAVPAATSYTWTVPAGCTILSGQGTTSITVQSSISFTSGAICVKAVNACGESLERCKNVSKLNSRTPRSLVGDLYGHCESVVNLSVPAVNGAISYNWTVPTGCIIISGQGTNAITFSTPAGFISGQVCVTANNGCTDSNPRCKTIFGAPERPSMGGPNFACAGQTNMYFVNPVPSAVTYDWTVPAGTVILNGQGTTIINVMHGTKTGRIRCYANNDCGNRGAAQIKVDILCRVAASDLSSDEPELSVIPNPTSDKATISLNGFYNTKTEIRITNLLGKEVYLKSVNYEQGNNIDLNLAELSKGIYFVTVNNNEQSKSTKLIVE